MAQTKQLYTLLRSNYFFLGNRKTGPLRSTKFNNDNYVSCITSQMWEYLILMANNAYWVVAMMIECNEMWLTV